MSDDDRKERLKGRSRGRSQTPQREQEEQTPQTEQEPQTPVTERNHSTFYLRDDLNEEIRRVRKQLELDFDMEYGFEIEKNRHFRPLLLYLGAQQVKDMDATEVKDVLDTTDVLDSTDITDEVNQQD